MSTDASTVAVPAKTGRGMPRIPIVTDLAKTRGWAYVIAWGHRISGLILIGYALFHVYTLMGLTDPAGYDAEMKMLSNPFFVFLEWALAIPVILHAMNGGRLLLYELFGRRDDGAMIRWVSLLSGLYVVFLGLLMIMGDQAASPVFYWLAVLIMAFVAVWSVTAKLVKVRHSIFWKLQRITASFLFVVIPAHMILSHLNLGASHEAAVVAARMQIGLVKVVDSLILLALAYHAGYALVSLARDYLKSMLLRIPAIILAAAILIAAAYFGLRLAWSI